MSERMSEFGTARPPIDLLQLFRGDIDASARIDAFKEGTSIVAEDIHEQLEGSYLEAINDQYDLCLVLNSHGNHINAGQTVARLNDPFITFAEGANAPDISGDPGFDASINNAFDMIFSGSIPIRQEVPFDTKFLWSHYRDRGLYKKASIITPIDVRSYSSRLLDSLMGQDYSQDMLNQRLSLTRLLQSSPDELNDTAINHGKLVMYSNGLREHVSALQIVKTLKDVMRVKAGEQIYGGLIDKRIRALIDPKTHEGKLEAGVIYGTAHHMFYHLLDKFGLVVSRQFASADDHQQPFKFTGSTLDSFFGAYNQELSDAQLEAMGRSFVLDSLFTNILEGGANFDVLPPNHGAAYKSYQMIPYIARVLGKNKQTYEAVLSDFKASPKSAVGVLREHGLEFRDI